MLHTKLQTQQLWHQKPLFMQTYSHYGCCGYWFMGRPAAGDRPRREVNRPAPKPTPAPDVDTNLEESSEEPPDLGLFAAVAESISTSFGPISLLEVSRLRHHPQCHQ